MCWKRSDLLEPVLEALRENGGAAHLSQVAKYIWKHYKSEIESSPILYTWQYDIRWAARDLREAGRMKPADPILKGIWRLSENCS